MILKVIHSFADTLYETVSVSPAFAEAATRRQVYGGSGMQFPAVVIIQPVYVACTLSLGRNRFKVEILLNWSNHTGARRPSRAPPCSSCPYFAIPPNNFRPSSALFLPKNTIFLWNLSGSIQRLHSIENRRLNGGCCANSHCHQLEKNERNYR